MFEILVSFYIGKHYRFIHFWPMLPFYTPLNTHTPGFLMFSDGAEREHRLKWVNSAFLARYNVARSQQNLKKEYINKCVKVIKNGPSKICGTQPLKNLK